MMIYFIMLWIGDIGRRAFSYIYILLGLL